MAWSWHAFHASTSQPLGTVDMVDWAHEDRLNDSGSWTATMAAPESAALTRAALAATLEARTVIVAIRTNMYGTADVMFAGYLPPGGRRTPDLAGAGLLSYLDLRELSTAVTYTAVDQFALVADLIARTQATGHGINIDVSLVGTSGVPRDQTWQAWERKNIGEAIRQKAAIIDGFDFDVRAEIDAGAIVRRLRCWYPRRGRTISLGGPTFTLGGNLTAIGPLSGSPTFVTETTGLGVETDEVTRERLTASTTADELITAGYPIINKTLDMPDIINSGPLQDNTDGYIAHYAVLSADELVLDVRPDDATWPWGSWELGDDCQVIIPAGVAPWWPDGLNETRRIVAHRWHLDADGETLQVVTGRPLA